MKAGFVVRTAFHEISPTAGTHVIKDDLLNRSFLIVKDNGHYIGLLTPEDVVETPRNLVVDCLHEKPEVSTKDDIDSVLRIMKKSRNKILPVFDNDDFVGVICRSDITDYLVSYKKELEYEVEKRTAELLGMERQLTQAQKMEAIGVMAAGFAHDFKNFLTPIIGYSELLMADFHDNPEAKDRLTGLLSAAHAANRLAAQILAYSKKSEKPHAPLNLQSVMQDAIQFLRASIPATVKINSRLDHSCRPVRSDPTQIHQILMNLCINAYQAMEETGGDIDIGLSEIELTTNEMAGQTDLKPGWYARITVSDTGPGIRSDVRDRIFEPYFSTKAPEIGTGLGLSITHSIVKEHGGAIQVFNRPGRGTTANVYLPLIKSTGDLEKEETILLKNDAL